MLRFSEDQIAALKAARLRAFVEDLADRALVRHPERAGVLSRGELVEGLAREVGRARSYGLRTRGELRRFSDLSMTFGFGFSEREGWARDLFEDRQRPASERLRAVMETAVFVVRERGRHG